MRHYTAAIVASLATLGLAGCFPNGQFHTTGVALEADARETTSSLLFAQETYFLENRFFAASMKELGSGIPLETNAYSYKVLSDRNNAKSIVITASSKQPELRSFTGVVFVFKSGRENVTLTQICVSQEASTVPPAAPSQPEATLVEIECSAGSQPAADLLARR